MVSPVEEQSCAFRRQNRDASLANTSWKQWRFTCYMRCCGRSDMRSTDAIMWAVVSRGALLRYVLRAGSHGITSLAFHIAGHGVAKVCAIVWHGCQGCTS